MFVLKNSAVESSLVELLEKVKVKYNIAPNSNINSPEVVSLISNRAGKVFIVAVH